LEKTLRSKLLHEGRHFSFRTDEVELPSGRRTRRDIVRHPGAVAIIPVLPDGRLVLVRQYRYAAGRALLELPAGTLEPGEEPLDCARRELREETGYETGEMRRLLSCFMAPGYSSEVIHFFEARSLRHVGDDLEPDEEIETETLNVDEARTLIEENAIEDAKTIIGVLSAFPHAKA
jgi:ADP-ribose pyrophosphatase